MRSSFFPNHRRSSLNTCTANLSGLMSSHILTCRSWGNLWIPARPKSVPTTNTTNSQVRRLKVVHLRILLPTSFYEPPSTTKRLINAACDSGFETSSTSSFVS